MELRPQVKLVDFPVISQASRPVAAVIGIARDGVAERQNRNSAAFTNRAFPPFRPTPIDQLVELRTRYDPLVRSTPSQVMRRGKGLGVGGSRAADFDGDGMHDGIGRCGRPRSSPNFNIPLTARLSWEVRQNQLPPQAPRDARAERDRFATPAVQAQRKKLPCGTRDATPRGVN